MQASLCRPLFCIAVAAHALASDRVRAEPRSEDGQVSLPFGDWVRLLQRSTTRAVAASPLPLTTVSRSITGEVRNGLLRATLSWRFVVLPGQSLRVPVFQGQASVTSAKLAGRATSLLRRNDEVLVEVPRPGSFDLKLALLLRASQEDFDQRLQLKLSPGASTQLSIAIDQRQVTASLASGALVGSWPRLTGYLDGSGLLDLRWSSRGRAQAQRAQLSCRLLGLLTVDENAMHGVSLIDLAVESGSVEHLDLQLPPDAEILKVSGPLVLQWQILARAQRRLRVLFRKPIEPATRLQVSYQAANTAHSTAAMQLPVLIPAEGVTFRASVGLQAAKSLDVHLERHHDAQLLRPSEWPSELIELTRNPLLHAFSFSRLPSLAIKLSQRPRMSLTSAVVDELHAATLILNDGNEVTKLRLQIRNNTRQHLRLRLPPGSNLLRAFVDGETAQPGLMDGEPGLLLVPLRQSQRIDRAHIHRVADGETLAEIANLYFSDPGQWPLILRANRLSDPRLVRAGQELQIPRGPQVTVEESAFALELAYQRGGSALGILGRRRLTLPELDLEVMRMHWHAFMPKDKLPVHFGGDLTQLSDVRFDVFRRVKQFFRQAMHVRSAWADVGRYRSILARHRSLYQAEVGSAGSPKKDDPMLFPLVGKRYRFSSLLVGRQTPKLTVAYLQHGLVDVIRWSALLLMAISIWLGLRCRRFWSRFGALAPLLPLLVVGYYVPGLYRRLIWGAVLGAAAALVERERRRAWLHLRERFWSPWLVVRAARWRSLLGLCGALLFTWSLAQFPLLLSSGVLVGLLVLWGRRRGAPAIVPARDDEVPDAPTL